MTDPLAVAPTPWTERNEAEATPVIRDRDGNLVLTVRTAGTYEQDEALAALIVELVNAHAARQSVPPPVDTAEAERLAEAERRLRVLARQTRTAGAAGLDYAALLAEYDRRGAVEQAAAAYVMAGLCGNPLADQNEKLAALIAAVRTNGESVPEPVVDTATAERHIRELLTGVDSDGNAVAGVRVWWLLGVLAALDAARAEVERLRAQRAAVLALADDLDVEATDSSTSASAARRIAKADAASRIREALGAG